ncbi:hypothetical protein HN958_03790 [Candidatus Falkowbacteria bacterium]|nr:hypothetical protein [Candidatus Falkowbacteria bacterium]MBT7007599.1 hypothetical protein [Candidatus Falkowbacteria bacterium]
MFYFLLTVLSILFAVLAIKKPKWAIALTVFALPAYLIRFSILNIPMTVLEVMILILFAVFVVKKFRQREKIELSNYKWLILLFLIAATIAVFVSTERVAALGLWKAYFIEPILFFIVLINTIKKKDFNLIINAIGFSALFVSIPAIIQKFWPIGIENSFWAAEETRRVVSFYGFPNAVGLYLAPIVILFIGLIIKGGYTRLYEARKQGQVSTIFFQLLVIVVSLLAIWFARSEGALVAVFVGIVLLGLVFPYKKLRLVTVLIVFLLSCFLAFSPFNDKVLDKLMLRDVSGQIRQQQWNETFEMLQDRKIVTGAGLSNYQNAIEPYHQDGVWLKDYNDPKWLDKIFNDEAYRVAHWQPVEIYMYPHNFILNFWSEIGLLGVIAFVLLLIKFIHNYKQASKEDRLIYRILIVMVITILIHGLVDVPYLKNDLSVFWWLIFGFTVII